MQRFRSLVSKMWNPPKKPYKVNARAVWEAHQKELNDPMSLTREDEELLVHPYFNNYIKSHGNKLSLQKMTPNKLAAHILTKYKLIDFSEKGVNHSLMTLGVPPTLRRNTVKLLANRETRRAIRSKLPNQERMRMEQKRNDDRYYRNLAIKMKYANQRGMHDAAGASVLEGLPYRNMIEVVKKFRNLGFQRNLRTKEQTAMSRQIANYGSRRQNLRNSKQEPMTYSAQKYPWKNPKHENVYERRQKINANRLRRKQSLVTSLRATNPNFVTTPGKAKAKRNKIEAQSKASRERRASGNVPVPFT